MLRPVAENPMNKNGALKTVNKTSFMSGKPYQETKMRALIVTCQYKALSKLLCYTAVRLLDCFEIFES